VDGNLHGARFGKNFKTREEAAAEQAMLGIKMLNAAIPPQASVIPARSSSFVTGGHPPVSGAVRSTF
jgi:hypothetical protein